MCVGVNVFLVGKVLLTHIGFLKNTRSRLYLYDLVTKATVRAVRGN